MKWGICKCKVSNELQKMCVDLIQCYQKPFSDCLSGPITDDINRSVNTSFPRA